MAIVTTLLDSLKRPMRGIKIILINGGVHRSGRITHLGTKSVPLFNFATIFPQLGCSIYS